jgi:hypothetical protein
MDEILNQLRTTFSTDLTGRGITTFFKGKQEIPAQGDMPILMVYPLVTRQEHTGTVRDSVEYDVGVEITVSLKQYFDSVNGQGTQLDALSALTMMIEERETDGDLKTNTVMGIINANLKINGRVLYTDNMEIVYEPYFDAAEFPAARATVTFTAFDRPNRT